MNERLEDKIIEPLAKLHINHIEQAKCILSCDSISIKVWQMELKSLLDNEPFYLFKKKHKEWEEKVKDIKEHLNHLYNGFDETLIDLQEFQNSLKLK